MQDNIRALLSTLHTVLWEGSGWTPPQMTDLVETGKVKRQYMKANLIIHPDKVSSITGTSDQHCWLATKVWSPSCSSLSPKHVYWVDIGFQRMWLL